MNTSWIGLAAVTAMLVAPDVLAAPKAADIQNRLASAVESLEAAARRSLTREETPAASAAAALQRCQFSLATTADIDERIEWVQRTITCLEVAEADFEMRRISADADTQRAFSSSMNTAANLRQEGQFYHAQLNAEKEFIGLKWGIGVGYSRGFDDIVETAEIVDGVVRVKKDLTQQPRVIFEFHSYRWCHKKRTGDIPIETGCGPFAAVVSRDDEVVSGVAAGWMYGWKTGTGDDAQGWSIGVGVIADSGGKELGTGYVEGQPPPDGATTVFLKEETVASALIFFTRTF
jgi:hypothetical protein